MNKYALGLALVAVGAVTQTVPAFADKLDDVLARLEAIEKNNAKLANENATLKARLNKVETTKSSAPATVSGVRTASAPATGIPTPPMLLTAPEIDANGHGFFEHKKGNPLTFYTPGGEITAYGNFDISVDDTAKSAANFNLRAGPLYLARHCQASCGSERCAGASLDRCRCPAEDCPHKWPEPLYCAGWCGIFERRFERPAGRRG